MKFFDKGELSILWIFYLEYFLASLLFFMPGFFVVYFYHLGFSFTQIGLLVAVTPLMTILFEVPTGAIADLYGRKFSVILGYIFEGTCMLLLFFVQNYYAMLFIFALWGIAMTFSSGSKDAWIVDLIRKKNKKLVPNFFNKLQIFISLGMVFSGILGVFLVGQYGLSIIWPVTTLSYLVSIILMSFAKEEYVSRKLKIKESLANITSQTKQTISYGYKHRVLFYYLLAMSVLVFAACFDSVMSWTSFLKGLEFPDAYFGYLWSGLALCAILATFISSKLLKKGKERNFIVICLILSAVVPAFLLLPQTWISALAILFFSVLFLKIRYPASEIYFHRFIPSKLRATMGSVRSMAVSIAAIIATMAAGYSIDMVGGKYTILLSLPIILIAIGIFMKIKEERKL